MRAYTFNSLSLQGNITLLEQKSLGFCGSRRASDKALRIARNCAHKAAEKDVIAVSGNAAGVDSAIHAQALQSGGSTIIVLPEGIEHFRIKSALRDIWDWQRVLVISQFPPKAPWKSYQAMARNKLIIALSQALIVIEAREKGGTLNAGMTALKNKKDLYVIEYDSDRETSKGNQILLSNGGNKIKKSRESNEPNLEQVFQLIGDEQGEDKQNGGPEYNQDNLPLQMAL